MIGFQTGFSGKGVSLDEIVKINFFGEEFRFRTEKHIENPEAVAACLEQHIEQAQELFRKNAAGTNKVVILMMAAMNLSKELQDLKARHTRLEETVLEKISSLAARIDKGIE